MGKLTRSTKRILIGLAGWAVILVGIVLIPFPGPGWVIVFIGFSILASEFDWAKEAKEWVHDTYEKWRKWYFSQSFLIQFCFSILSFATAVLIVWLVNGYGFLNTWLHLNQRWLVSPFFK